MGGVEPVMDLNISRPIYFFARYTKALTDDFVRTVIRECGPKTQNSRLPPDELLHRQLQFAKSHNFVNHLGNWEYPHPFRVASGIVQGAVSLPLTLRQRRFAVSMTREVEIPFIMNDPAHWLRTNSGGDPDSRTAAGASWFLDRVRPLLPVFEPDFAFADTDLHLVKNLDGIDIDPAALSWPLMVLGPERVAKLGRDHVAATPAWKVEFLPYGGAWIQAAENPFDMLQPRLVKLAAHLGLTPRR
jgi:hypothetical protein